MHDVGEIAESDADKVEAAICQTVIEPIGQLKEHFACPSPIGGQIESDVGGIVGSDEPPEKRNKMSPVL